MIFDQVEAEYSNTLHSVVTLPFVSFVKYLHGLDHVEATQFWKSQLANIEAP